VAWITKYRRGDGGTSYRVGWRDPAGKTHLKTFRRRADADDWSRKVEGDKQRGDYLDPRGGRITFGDYLEVHMATATHLKPSSRSLYRGHAGRYLLPVLGSRPLASITTSDVKGLLASLSGIVGPATVLAVYRLLRRVLNAAVEDGRLGRNPAARVKLPAEERREPRFLSPEQIRKLAAEVLPQYRALVLLLAYGGLRIGEAAALRVRDVDFLRARVFVRRNSVEVDGQLIEGTPKGGAIRTVRIPGTVVEVLAQHVEEFAPEGPEARVFRSESGGPLRQSRFRSKVFSPAVSRAGLAPLRVHDLRHTAVALAIAAGYHPKAVQELAGHASITMTLDRYGHLFDTLQDAGVERLDEMARSGGNAG
jgi:integrase